MARERSEPEKYIALLRAVQEEAEVFEGRLNYEDPIRDLYGAKPSRIATAVGLQSLNDDSLALLNSAIAAGDVEETVYFYSKGRTRRMYNLTAKGSKKLKPV